MLKPFRVMHKVTYKEMRDYLRRLSSKRTQLLNRKRRDAKVWETIQKIETKLIVTRQLRNELYPSYRRDFS